MRVERVRSVRPRGGVSPSSRPLPANAVGACKIDGGASILSPGPLKAPGMGKGTLDDNLKVDYKHVIIS